MSKFESAAFQWRHDDDGAQYGEGVSRPVSGKRTRQYRIKVHMAQSQPMSVILSAESKSAAIKYAQNRWPNAKIKFNEAIQKAAT